MRGSWRILFFTGMVILGSLGTAFAASAPVFSPPQNVSDTLLAGFAPSIATDGRNVYAAWHEIIGDNSEIFLTASRDDGSTWSTPQNISDSLPHSREPSVTTDGTTVYATWHEIIGDNSEIFLTASRDDGSTWSTPQNISYGPYSGFRPAIATDGASIYVVWEDVLNANNHEVFLTISTDNGSTWSTPQDISDSSPLPSLSPSVATDGTHLYLTWEESIGGIGEILFTASRDDGSTWSTPQNISNSSADSLTSSVSTDGTHVFVTWEESIGDTWEILLTSSTDGGSTWSTPQKISNSSADSSTSSVSTDGTHLYLTWEESIGGFWEILLTSSTDGGSTWRTPQNISKSIF